MHACILLVVYLLNLFYGEESALSAEKCAQPIVAYVWSKQTVQRHWPTVWVVLVVLA